MAITRFKGDHARWVQAGKKAAETGKTNEALYAVCSLLFTFISAAETIIDNQFELYAAIQAAAAKVVQPQNGHKP